MERNTEMSFLNETYVEYKKGLILKKKYEQIKKIDETIQKYQKTPDFLGNSYQYLFDETIKKLKSIKRKLETEIILYSPKAYKSFNKKIFTYNQKNYMVDEVNIIPITPQTYKKLDIKLLDKQTIEQALIKGLYAREYGYTPTNIDIKYITIPAHPTKEYLINTIRKNIGDISNLTKKAKKKKLKEIIDNEIESYSNPILHTLDALKRNFEKINNKYIQSIESKAGIEYINSALEIYGSPKELDEVTKIKLYIYMLLYSMQSKNGKPQSNPKQIIRDIIENSPNKKGYTKKRK